MPGRFCRNCGTPVSSGGKYCRTCGRPLAPLAAAQGGSQPLEQPPPQRRAPSRWRWAVAVGLAAAALAVAALLFLPRDGGPPRPALHGKVVVRDQHGQPVPVPGAVVKVGMDEGTSDKEGRFAVALSSGDASGDEPVRISHENYVARFLRYDDPDIGREEPIELSPKMRIVVIDASARPGESVGGSDALAFTSALEDPLHCSEIELLADEGQRDDIVTQLHRCQEGRALYDPHTLQRVGDFHGATHGAFWTTAVQGSTWIARCRLVSLTTGKIVADADTVAGDGETVDRVGARLADFVLSQLTEVRILRPKPGATCGHDITVEGYALYRPKGWSLWISLQPDRSALHYPQLKLTVQEDGSWFTSAVYLGTEGRLREPLRARIYGVLTDPECSRQIDAYLVSGANDGLDVNAWDNKRCRVLAHVDVTRDDSAR